MRLSVEDMLGIVSSRERKREVLREVLKDAARLHPDVRAFLEELVREQPGQDLRILAARLTQEHSSQEGRGAFARAMRRLLP